MKNLPNWIIFFLSFFLFINKSSANTFDSYGFESNTSVLPASQAFKINVEFSDQELLTVSFNIAQDYYIYKNRLQFSTVPNNLLNLGKVQFPSGIFLHPEKNSRDDEVLSGVFILNIPLSKKSHTVTPTKLKVVLQGCNVKSVCYPPQEYNFDLTSAKTGAVVANTAAIINVSQAAHSGLWANFKQLYNGTESNGSSLSKNINIFELVIIFFLAGFAIALTPCMYPLYPIALSTIIGTGDTEDTKNTLKLAFCYIHGIAFVYVIMGFLAAISGKLLTTALQKPQFILLGAMILLIMAIAMFDLLDIQLSNKVQSYLQVRSSRLKGGSFIAVFIVGSLSALLLGPCVTPPLIIAIGFIATQGSVILGVAGLYAIAIGMGVPILLLATLGNRLLPKSGNWMNFIKYLMASIILAASIYLAYPFIRLGSNALSIGILCFVIALVFLIIKYSYPPPMEVLIHKIVPIVMIIAGIAFTVYGALQLKASVNSDLSLSSQQTIRGGFTIVKSKAQLEGLMVENANKPILLDFYASWCAICKEMATTTFSNPQVFKHLSNYRLIQVDVTDNTPETGQLLQQFGLYGPPALIVFDSKHHIQHKLLGLTTPEKLIANTQ